MENSKEILEISKWLQSKGLRSKTYATWDYSCGDMDYYIIHYVGYFLENDEFENETGRLPWFSLERVLELLPKKIEIKDHMIIEPDIPECLGVFEDVVFYFTLDGDGVRYQRYCQYEGGIEESIFREEGDYHLAALKLLKKVIETYGMEIVNESRTN